MAGGIITLVITIMVGFGSSAGAEMESGEFSSTIAFSGEAIRIHMVDKSPRFIVAEFTGTALNDKGDGLFHKMSVDCTFAVEVADLPSTVATGYCTFLDVDGDEIVIRVGSKGAIGVGEEYGSIVAVSGTGKYQGITLMGTYQTTLVPDTTPNPRVRARRTFRGNAKFSGTYQRP